MSETQKVQSITEAPSYASKLAADTLAKKKMYRRRRAAVGLLAATGIVAGAAVADAVTAPDFSEKVAASVESNPTILNATIVLHEGATLRSTPSMNNGDSAGNAGNVIEKVDAGEVAVLDYPLVYTNHVGQEFLGAVDDSGKYVWVNARAMLDDEKVSGRDYVTYIFDNRAPKTNPGQYADGAFYRDEAHQQSAATMHMEQEEVHQN